MARLVGRLRPPLGEVEELVAHLQEGHVREVRLADDSNSKIRP